MQQRGTTASQSLDSEDGYQQNLPPSRGRPTSKLRVLGRSHAMREEASPPREPCQGNPLLQQQIQSPCIKLTPSPEPPAVIQGKPVVVLSLSPDRTAEDRGHPLQGSLHGEGVSPASTLVPTPNSRCSPVTHEHHSSPVTERLHSSEGDLPPSPKYLNSPDKERSSHSNSSLRKTINRYCECQSQNCIKCVKDRSTNVNNVNNNHSSSVNNNVISSPNMLYVSRGGSGGRGRLRQQSSSQGSFGSFESSSMSPCLSRDNSSEQYTDFGGVDLEQFIPDTLNRNAKDRALMLRIEQELVNLAKDRIKSHYKFPPMSSYQRMLVHRCAAYFGMDHNIEPSGKCVVVNKTKNTRIPEVEFREHIKDDIIFSEEPRRSILKRDSNSIEDYGFKSPDIGYDNRRSKSFEEREEEYEKARRRIFSREMHEGTSEDSGWSEIIPWSSTESEYISKYRLQPPELQARHLRRLLKVHSEDTVEAMRPCVAKSFSFGGYGGGSVSLLTRGDSIMSTHSAGPRLFTKQDSGASSCISWRLSPSSSGYKSQSQMSESVTPSPTNTPHPLSEEGGEGGGHHKNKPDSHLVWAVTDIHSVPKGSIIINPETGKPLKNDDGTIYHYDPNRPPPGFFTEPSPPSKVDAASSPQRSPQREVAPRSPQREKLSHSKPSSAKASPVRKQSSFTNSATSPSLPFSPPLSTCSSAVHSGKSCNYLQTASSCENVTNLPQTPPPPPHYSNYSAVPAESNVSAAVYPQPYIVYTAPYGCPVQQQFDGRLDPPSITPDLATTYYVAEGHSQPPSQPAIAYQHQPPQPPPYWSQPPFYQTGAAHAPSVTPPQRYSVTIPAQGQTIYMPTGYPTTVNYLTQPAPAPPPQCAPSAEMVPIYHGQPVQMVYTNQPSTPTPVIYAQNPVVYSAPGYPPTQTMPSYPQSTPTPGSCNSSVSTHQFMASSSNQPTDLSPPHPGYIQLTQSMHQMTLGASPQTANPRGFMAVNMKYTPPFDQRPYSGSKSVTPKFSSQPRGSFTGCSGQNSGGTNSPAGTVISTNYCAQSAGAPGIPPPFRTPTSTPPTPQFFSFQPGFNGPPPRLFRQMSGGREQTNRSSRSPTPAGDITHFDRPRMSLPPNLYQGLPFILQPDPRFFGRGQPNVYRQTPPTLSRQSSLNNQDNNRSQNSNKGRKPRGTNRQGGLPPNGQK